MTAKAPCPNSIPIATAPALASPDYDGIVDRYGLAMLKEPGDLQLADGDLALTKDLDLMLGDKSYNALFRLVQHWRHNAAHVACLMGLLDLMIARYHEALDRLDHAATTEASRKRKTGNPCWQSQEFSDAWQRHFDEEGTAITGAATYAGCVVMLAGNALLRFRDNFDAPAEFWRCSGPRYGGRSVGEILVASANGFRHADEWVKTRPMTEQQRRSADVLAAVLGPVGDAPHDLSPPDRCHEVIALLSGGGGFDGFSAVVLGFAHEVAMACRSRAA